MEEILDLYYGNIVRCLEGIRETQRDNIKKAAEKVSQVIRNDGIIYVFGCGHSSLIAADTFYRAGGLANVSAMLDGDLTLNDGAVKSSALERTEGIACHIFDHYRITLNDVLIIVTNSGVNSVPIEMAMTAKENGIFVIGISSSAYKNQRSRHSSGKLFYQCVDVCIDNCVPKGDATIDITGSKAKMGSVSTAASSYAINSILISAAIDASEKGAEVPVYLSGNVAGGPEFNKKIIDKYKKRINKL